MPTIHRPRRGSLAYSPRKRAKKEVPTIKAWPSTDEVKLQGFAGYKAGMTHVITLEKKPESEDDIIEVSVPVTVIEVPEMKVAALRGYTTDSYGKKAAAEAWAAEQDKELSRKLPLPKKHNTEEQLKKMQELIEDGTITDIKAIVHTRANKVSGIPKKKPDVMECNISGKDIKERFEYAKSILGTTVKISDVFKNGELIDVLAVTKGKGTQGPVKRWGISLMKHKHSRAGSLRQVGNLGPWTPSHVSWRVPQLGQTGYHTRTEFNKTILKIGEAEKDNITPPNGFINYGVVRNDYVLIKGSVPGPVKRLIRMRPAIRPKKAPGEPQIIHISLKSTQG
jgi:large subunit ribosomal protein L3